MRRCFLLAPLFAVEIDVLRAATPSTAREIHALFPFEVTCRMDCGLGSLIVACGFRRFLIERRALILVADCPAESGVEQSKVARRAFLLSRSFTDLKPRRIGRTRAILRF